VGIIYLSGHHRVIVDGLRQGLRELGLEEGKHVILDIREIGDLKASEEAARDLERGKVDLIYTVTSDVTIPTKRATARTPIVFYVGADPVAAGLVESFAKPGGRLTGVHSLARDLIAKRLEILKELVPGLGRVVTFYDPGAGVAPENARLGRVAAGQLRVELVERQVGSIEELRLGLQGLKPGEVQAYFHTPGYTVTRQALLIIDAAKAKKLPTMFHESSLVAKGPLPVTATATTKSAACRRSMSSGFWRGLSPETSRSRTTTGSSSPSISAPHGRSASRSPRLSGCGRTR
jgi:putative ABC transport system substrate-binding protein